MSNEITLEIDDTPITLDNFFVGHHYSNKEHVYDDDKETVLNEELAYPSIEKINHVEKSLNIQFPEKLTQLYLKQNGGPVGGLMIPKIENPSLQEEDWITPFSGYDDLYTLESVRTVFDSVGDYAYYPENIEMYPKNSERLIILAQWYRHTLFLDYREVGHIKADTQTSSQPRVGFVDFDCYDDLQKDTWESEAFWWDNFDHFFSLLVRGEYV